MHITMLLTAAGIDAPRIRVLFGYVSEADPRLFPPARIQVYIYPGNLDIIDKRDPLVPLLLFLALHTA